MNTTGNRLIDMTGYEIGAFKIIGREPNYKRGAIKTAAWIGECVNCGAKKIITRGAYNESLRRNSFMYCHNCMTDPKTKHGDAALDEYGQKSRLYSIWSHMKTRCSPTAYGLNRKNYYDRGIIVCKEWSDSYEVFKSWAIENGYNDELTIERIDVNGNYEPNNCKWITKQEQIYNRRNTLWVIDNGTIVSLAKLCNKIGYPHNRANDRHRTFRRYGISPITSEMIFSEEKPMYWINKLKTTPMGE